MTARHIFISSGGLKQMEVVDGEAKLTNRNTRNSG